MRTFKQARTEARLSLTDCARVSGLNRSTVVCVQSGTTSPRYATAVRLARAMGADPHEIEELAPAMFELEEVPA